jgi:peptide/nickel transport system permease protein
VRYFLQRFARFLIVFFLVTFGVMVLLRIGLNAPGDPARTMLGGTASDAQVATVTKRYHLDSNLFIQYLYWLKDMLHLDMGVSVQQNLTVAKYIKPRILVTVFLGVYSIVWAIIIAVPLAVFSAYKRDSFRDKVASTASFFFVSIPALVLAPVLIFVFVSHLGWFPRIGEKVYPWNGLGTHFKNFFLPTLVLTLPLAAIFTRLLRADMIATLQSDFITLASAKGVSPQRVLWRHALRNSLFSVLTSVGLQIGGLVGGAIIVEQFFNMNGMGTLLVGAILAKDLFVVQSVVAILVAVVVIANLVIDLLYAVVDPRIRQMRKLG